MRNVASIASIVLIFSVQAAAWASAEGGPATLAQKLAANATYVRGARPQRALIGGDDFGSATLITALPFGEIGNTCMFNDDYAPDCAFDGNSAATDVVYRFQPSENICVDLSLCGSGFDNTVSVYRNAPDTLVVCSDDACGLNARIEGLTLKNGNDYFIVVDGWAEQCGEYQILVKDANPAIRGRAAYFMPSQNRIPGVEVCVQPGLFALRCGDSSNLQGSFKVAGVPPGPAVLLAQKPAEVTDPNAIGGGDINVMIAALSSLILLTPDQEIAADVDGSGGPPTTGDLQQLRRYLVFDFTSCLRCGTWDFFADSLGTYVPVPDSLGDLGCGSGNVTLKGIYRADVDGSWPNRFKASIGASGWLEFGEPRWDGAECVLPLAITAGEAPSTSALFTLEYDPGALDWIGAEVGAAAPGFELTVNPATAGVVHALLAGGMRAMSSAAPVAELRFRLRSGHDRGAVAFTRLLVNDQEAAQMPAITISPGGQTDALPRACTVAAVPNPFNPSARVEYTVPAGAGTVPVSLRVIDLAGHVVRELVRSSLGPGRYNTVWNGNDVHGAGVASGVYVLQLQAGSTVTTQKAVLVR